MTDREHDVLEAISKTIRAYDEETIFEALRRIADRFDWELAKRDPGPDEDVESGNVWPRESDIDLAHRAFGMPRGNVFSLHGGWR